MNEGLALPSNIETELGSIENSELDYINPNWDDSVLFNIVAANHDLLVNNGGKIMTLSEAILAHPGPWVPENEANILADIQQLLANRVIENEESDEAEALDLEEEESPEIEEEIIEAEVKTEKLQTFTKIAAREKDQADIVQSHMGDSKKDIKITKQKERTNPQTNEVVSPRNVLKNEIEKPESLTLESKNDDVSEKAENKTIKVADISETADTNLSAPENKSEYAISQAEPASIIGPPESDLVTNSEEGLLAINDAVAASEENKDFSADDNFILHRFQENKEEAEETSAINSDTAGHDVGSAVLQDINEADMEDEFNFPINYSSNIIGQIDYEFEDFEARDSSIAENGKSIVDLAAQKLTYTPEKVEAVFGSLDKLVDVAEKINNKDQEDYYLDVELNEEITESFSKLLENLEINLEPDLIEVLAYLTIKGEIIEVLRSLKPEKELTKTAHDKGTHEIIENILDKLGIAIKALSNATIIGRSAIQLYRANLVT